MAFDLKTALTGLAPTLASMLGGPLAGTAVSALESAFGLTAGAGQDGITNAMQAGAMTPEIAAAVRKADQEHAEKLKAMDVDLVKLNADHDAAMASVDAGDRDSARKREESVKDWTPMVLAYLVTLGFFGVLAFLLLAGKPQAGGDVLLVMLGSLGTAWTAIISYFYGSTSANKTKDLTIKALAQ